MKEVEPIRDKDVLYNIYQYLEGKKVRDYLLFMVGTNTGLRISDILPLKVKHFRNKTYLSVREKKTGKIKEIPITKELAKAIAKHTSSMSAEDYLFLSQRNKLKPIKRDQAYRIIKAAAKEFGVDNVGTHSMRKTFGYHFYKKHKDVEMLRQIYNHASASITLRYIGVLGETTNKAMREFTFF